MSAFLDHAATAALPVAIGLLLLAACARAALWVPVDDEQVRRTAAHHLEPLSTWCLIATVTYAVALGGAGKGLVPLLFPLGIAAVAVLLRPDGTARQPTEAVAAEPGAPPARAEEAPARESLWSR